eukprot:14932098-Heterocapsa_arctica.AAC.1
MVYVDDFKLSGPAKNMIKGWSLIRHSIKTDESQPVNKCLGCHHTMVDTNVKGKTVRQMIYNMEPFM